MRKKTILGMFVIAVATFLGGWLLTQPLRGQAKDEKPAPVTPGRYQAVPLAGGDMGVLDTSTGHAWKYAANLGMWGDLGTPADEVKPKK
jgi:hypothetical protein